jgi:transposase
LRVHHITEVKEILARVKARPLYLPTYSPERNPIEEAWSTFKRRFRSGEPRNIPEIVDTMIRAWAEITTENLHAYFTHAGYD